MRAEVQEKVGLGESYERRKKGRKRLTSMVVKRLGERGEVETRGSC